MAAAIFTVTLLLGFAVLAALIVYEARQIKLRCDSARQESAAANFAVSEAHTTVREIRDVLKEASRLKSAKVEQSERATIPLRGAPRYVPLSQRRAQAERESQGPMRHDERVRENNARAIESAG